MITVIGDSIVYGFPHRKSQSFTSVLREKYGWDTVNKGINGDTTEGVLARFEKDAVSKHPQMILLHIGTNDFTEGADAGYVFSQVKRILEKAGDIPVYILTPVLTYPPMAAKMWMPADYDRVNREMKKYVSMLKDEGINCFDIQKTVSAFSEGRHIESVYVDGIHPTIPAHNTIAEFLDREIRGVI